MAHIYFSNGDTYFGKHTLIYSSWITVDYAYVYIFAKITLISFNLCLQNGRLKEICLYTLCTKSFTRQYRVNFDIRNTHARLQVDTVCATCNRRFARTYAKNRHVNIVHRMIKSFVCDECNKTFSLRTNLQGHMRSKHGGNKLKV